MEQLGLVILVLLVIVQTRTPLCHIRRSCFCAQVLHGAEPEIESIALCLLIFDRCCYDAAQMGFLNGPVPSCANASGALEIELCEPLNLRPESCP